MEDSNHKFEALMEHANSYDGRIQRLEAHVGFR